MLARETQKAQFCVRLQSMRDAIDVDLQMYLANSENLLEELFDSIRYTLFSGGKRIRPLFCLLAGELFDVPRGRLRSVACALEMIHTASLIMDDLPHMDCSAIRRGKIANHLVYGQDVAALASIGLLTRAYEIVLSDPELETDIKSQVVGTLAHAVGIHGMAGGQLVDLKSRREGMPYEILEYIHLHKTAALFIASGTAAAVIGHALPPQLEALQQFARKLGFAFQIRDDILDSTGTEEDIGKPVHKDTGNFVDHFGLQHSAELVERYLGQAIASLRIFQGRQEALVALAHMLLQHAGHRDGPA